MKYHLQNSPASFHLSLMLLFQFIRLRIQIPFSTFHFQSKHWMNSSIATINNKSPI
jgi:hypothetical protein